VPNYFWIAIDGPVASGKSSVTRYLAQKLHLTYIDTGAMYRAVTWLAIRNGVSVDDPSALVELIDKAEIVIRSPLPSENHGRLSTVLVNGQDVSWLIRQEPVNARVSTVAAHHEVRSKLVVKQRFLALNQDVIMEGRDITYRVLPEAQLKIYLTASEEERIKRHYFELIKLQPEITLEQAGTSLRQRDKNDKTRVTDPLRIMPDAWVVDTTKLSIVEVANLIMNEAMAIRSKIK